eukprot:TRINITY_DN6710_c0_g3_i1.p1 TRINITY_DN6710_c0_g3~~TRINITY_DN6710_c0_g3_i1.p1  ORF type:complete len:515 (+),score=121.23 TRINITY_DN6710_c0_g3_i1:45-1589(+)
MGDNIGNVSEGIGGLNLSEDGVATRKGEFPLLDLPDPALNKILNFLSTKEKNTLRLCSKTYDETIFNLCESTRKWYITIDEDNKKDQMAVLIAAKMRQTVKPRDLEISININCCKELGTIDAIQNPYSVKLPDCLKMKKKLVRDWQDNITELKTEILGNESFLRRMTFPKLASLEFRIYQTRTSTANMQIMERAFVNNATTVKELFLQNVAMNAVTFVPNLPKPFPVTALRLDKWQLETVNLLLESSKDTLNALDLHACFSMMQNPFSVVRDFRRRLPKLEHLQIRYCIDEFKGILYRIDPFKLISLRLIENDFLDYGPMSQFTFPKLKFFWIDCVSVCAHLAKHNLMSLEVLVAIKSDFSLQNDFKAKAKMKFPKLKELFVEGNNSWSPQIIKQNASTLERLTILNPKEGFSKLMALNCEFPNMKMLALRFEDKEPLDSLVSSMESRCPASARILTDYTQICDETRKHAETYSYPMPDIVDEMEGLVKIYPPKDHEGFEPFFDGLGYTPQLTF